MINIDYATQQQTRIIGSKKVIMVFMCADKNGKCKSETQFTRPNTEMLFPSYSMHAGLMCDATGRCVRWPC